MLSYIWAEDRTGVIGDRGRLPWHLPTEMHHFTVLTTGHPIIMGARTFRSFPKGPLPNRRNLVLTHQLAHLLGQGIEVIHDVESIHRMIDAEPAEEFFVIGGNSLFESLLPLVDKLYQTRIDHDYRGDVRMIPIPWNQFELVRQRQLPADGQIPALTFNEYRRIKGKSKVDL